MQFLVPVLLPLAARYVAYHERLILRQGVLLDEAQRADAMQIGIQHSDKVRLMKVDSMPWPEQEILQQAAKWAGLMIGKAAGVTFGYGIYIRSTHWGNRRLLRHELTHTMQYERLGGIRPFLRQYLTECLTVGYYHSPLEQEAIKVQGSSFEGQ